MEMNIDSMYDERMDEDQSTETEDKLSNLILYDNGHNSGNTSSAEESNSDRLTAGSPSSDGASASCEPNKTYQIYEQESEQYGSRLLRSVSRTRDNDEKEDDYDYTPRYIKKTIMVGSKYQASIPDGLSMYGDVLPYDNQDKLLWDPSQLTDSQVEDYLRKARAKNKEGQSVYALPLGKHLKDDEQALFLLQQCGHNTTEALRRRRINMSPPMSLWSEEECRNFETGLRSYGKNFHLTQQNKVRTRSVGELVQFYYLWKKTERHDVFANKSRLEKKKYTLHPGVTDFMDRFLDEQEQISNQERSSSPFVFGGEPVISAKANLLDKSDSSRNLDF